MAMTAPADTTAVDEAFRDRVREYLAAHCEVRPPAATAWGVGSDALVEVETDPDRERDAFERARDHRRALAGAGLAWLTGPTDLGGAGLSRAHEEAFEAIAAGYAVPDHICFIVGLHIVAPAVAKFGSDTAKQRYLAALHSGDVIGCQLFSEPDAGSDLAGVRTRAVRDGDGWRISGQKVWTSGAHHADIGEALVRTDPDAPKHRGLTMMLVDMHDPGVSVRPLEQITGSKEFCEVFLDNVFVPDDHVLAAPGDGWKVANATLSGERESMGDQDEDEADPATRLAQAAAHFGLTDDPIVRQDLARLHSLTEIIRHTGKRFEAMVDAGDPSLTGSEPALLKLMMTNKMLELVRVSGSVIGPRMVADTGEWGTYAWADYCLMTPSHRIAGGTDEIMRNVIGERILGLPREPRPAS